MRLMTAMAVVGLLGLVGCAGKDPTITTGAVYPAVKQGSVADIQVLRDGTSVSMTNTTAEGFTGVRLWANQWYSLEVAEWRAGQTLTLDLASFKDRYGGGFKAGGFFAIDNPEKLVQMQVEREGALIGLVVIGQSE